MSLTNTLSNKTHRVSYEQKPLKQNFRQWLTLWNHIQTKTSIELDVGLENREYH